jgi:hypothetical protein
MVACQTPSRVMAEVLPAATQDHGDDVQSDHSSTINNIVMNTHAIIFAY